MTSSFQSWGGLVGDGSLGLVPDVWRDRPTTVLPFGNGRSYGDSCLNDHAGLILGRQSARILSFDEQTGLLVAEAGLLLSDLISAVLPAGWFPPVVPGTRFVTLGGALANDVHGKNHHVAGTFGRHVLWFDLERSDESMLHCAPDENADLFSATIGGMGLTGFVRRIALQLKAVRSSMIDQQTAPFDNLDAFFDIAADTDASAEYSVAWIDSLAKGSRLGRGVYFRGNDACHGPLMADSRGPSIAVPFRPPFSMLNRLSLTAFNSAYRFAHRRQKNAPTSYAPFFFPLDRIGQWNRIYGPRGLRQFQCVVPRSEAKRAIPALLEATHEARAASFLTVLKMFGDVPSPGLMSFPMPGATLTLDFPYHGERTDRLLARLDAITLEAGGRINPYKDARMPADVFRACFPRMDAFKSFIDPKFSSNFWRRASS